MHIFNFCFLYNNIFCNFLELNFVWFRLSLLIDSVRFAQGNVILTGIESVLVIVPQRKRVPSERNLIECSEFSVFFGLREGRSISFETICAEAKCMRHVATLFEFSNSVMFELSPWKFFLKRKVFIFQIFWLSFYADLSQPNKWCFNRREEKIKCSFRNLFREKVILEFRKLRV